MLKMILMLFISALVTFFIIAVRGEKECYPAQSPVKVTMQAENDGLVQRTYETPSVVGDIHSGRLFEILVPQGWEVYREDSHTRLMKRSDVTMAIEIMEIAGAKATLHEYITAALGQLVAIERSVIGKNSYVRLAPKIGIADSSTLVAKTGSGIITIVAGKFNYPEVLTILGSIKLK